MCHLVFVLVHVQPTLHPNQIKLLYRDVWNQNNFRSFKQDFVPIVPNEGEQPTH